jgi:hypothetical protein
MSTPLGKITGLDKYEEAANPNRGGLGMFNAAFGNSAEKFSQGRELDDDDEIKANWKDRLFGHSTEELTEEYFKRQAKRLKQDQRADILRAEGKDVSVETTNAQLEKRVKALNQLTAAQKAAAAAGLLDLAKLEDTNEILAGIRKAGDYEYGGPKYMMMQEEQRRLDRQQERLLADRRLDQNYQLEITRLQSKDRERAQNRKDRMFLQLMAGLQNLGQGFTI